MAKRTVIWTFTAAKQRREIFKYWTERNGSSAYAEKLIKLINKQINTILIYPESFKLADFPDTRESALGYFSLYYKLTPTHLVINAFWDNRQDPKKLLILLNNKNLP